MTSPPDLSSGPEWRTPGFTVPLDALPTRERRRIEREAARRQKARTAAAEPFYSPTQPRSKDGKWKPGGGGLYKGEQSHLADEARSGGFTYSTAAKTSPTRGFSVSPYPDRTRVIDTADFKPEHLHQYAKANAEVLSQPDHHLGAWRDTSEGKDRIWLDVSIVKPNRAAAVITAKQHDQKAIYDLSTGTVIDTGGTGGQAAHGAVEELAGTSRRGERVGTGGHDPGGHLRAPTAAERAGRERIQRAGTAGLTAAAAHTGGMIALVPTEADAARLAIKGMEPADVLHCTLLFLGESEAWSPQARQSLIAALPMVFQGSGTVPAFAFGCNLWNPAGDEPSLVLAVGDTAETAGALQSMHEAAEMLVELTGQSDLIPAQHSPWVAHVCLAYSGDPAVMQALVERVGPLTFDRVRVAFTDKDVTDVPLVNTAGQ